VIPGPFGRLREEWRRRRRLRREGPRDFLLRRMPPGGVCAEVGVFRAEFSERILRIASPRVLHLIDPWKYESSEEYSETIYGGEKGGSQAAMDAMHDAVLRRFRREVREGRVVVHRGTSAEVGPRIPEGSLDWVYIDGNHLYEFARADLESFYPRVRTGGFLTGDDYAPGGWWKGGVMRAVDEFVAGGRVEVVSLEARQFILRKR
jgi:hypothetical protein